MFKWAFSEILQNILQKFSKHRKLYKSHKWLQLKSTQYEIKINCEILIVKSGCSHVVYLPSCWHCLREHCYIV